MAQLSYANDVFRRSKTLSDCEPPKRTALSVINGRTNFPVPLQKKCAQNSHISNWSNLLKKSNSFGPQKYQIFEDKVEEPSPKDENESPGLSESVKKLVTFNSSEKSDEKDFDKTVKYNEQNFDRSFKKIRNISPTPDDKALEKSETSVDLVWCCSPYKNDIYGHLKDMEKKFRPRPSYMQKQPDITMSMRSVLIDWLIEVGEEYKLQVETLHLAVSYTDRFLSRMSVLRGKLQLVGTACLFIASKYEEIYPPELKDFVYITDDTYTKKQVLRMEHLILKVLAFDVASPTAYTFLHLFSCMSGASDIVTLLAQYICELSLLEADPFLNFLPSQTAAASLALSNYSVGYEIWNEGLQSATGYELNELRDIIQSLYDRYSTISSYPQQAICEKYKSSKFRSVSAIQHPETLVF